MNIEVKLKQFKQGRYSGFAGRLLIIIILFFQASLMSATTTSSDYSPNRDFNEEQNLEKKKIDSPFLAQGPSPKPWFGVRMLQETIFPAGTINGGSYLYVEPFFRIRERHEIQLRYSTDLSPHFFHKHLLTTSLKMHLFAPHWSKSNLNPHYSLSYMVNLKDMHGGNYLGIRICPISNDPEGDQLTFDLFATTIMWNIGGASPPVLRLEIFSLGIGFK